MIGGDSVTLWYNFTGSTQPLSTHPSASWKKNEIVQENLLNLQKLCEIQQDHQKVMVYPI